VSLSSSIGDALRDGVRELDPTSSTSALGGVVRQAMPYVPYVGGLASNIVNSKAGMDHMTPAGGAVVQPGAPYAGGPAPVASAWWSSPMFMLAAAAAGVLVVFSLLRK
jgi:hypothetical protein